MKSFAINRRDFLKTGAFGISGVLMLPSCLKGYTPWQFFTPEEAVCMAAISEQIIPLDENGPGASQAGVIYYIDKQLDEVFTWDRDDYRSGLAAIQHSAKQLYDKKFEELEFDIQTDFLRKMESGELPSTLWEGMLDQRTLFRKMIQHSMQGFYGSPRHGGNKNYMSFRMMKLDYPYIVGQNRYRELQNQ